MQGPLSELTLPFLYVMGFFDAQEDGEDFQAALHLTLLPGFSLPEASLPLFREAPAALAAQHPPLLLLPTEKMMLGPFHNMPAVKVEAYSPLQAEVLPQLHRELVLKVRELGGSFQNEEYVLEGYRPHVSYYDERGHYELTSLTLVEHRGGFGVDMHTSGPHPLKGQEDLTQR